MRTFTGHTTLRYGPLFDGPDGLSTYAIKYISESGLRYLGHCLDRCAIHDYVDKVWCRGHVIIPQSMVHGLKMPEALTSVGIQGDNGFGKQVFFQAFSAPVVIGGSRGR